MYKTITCLIGCLLLILSVGIAGKASAQNQKQTAIPLNEALKTIQKRFGTQFAYEHDLLEGKSTDKNALKGKSVEEVLKNVLYPNNLIFLYVSENTYSIVARTSSFFNGAAQQQNLTAQVQGGTGPHVVRGNITDQQGKPVPYANVWVKGTNQATQANEFGAYLLPAVQPGSIIMFSLMGYTSFEITVNDNFKLDIVLTADVKTLSEVTIVSNGYQQISRERSTGSAVVLTSKDIQKYPSPNILQRLEGLAPGVQFNVVAGDRSFTYQSGQSLATGLSPYSGTRTIGTNDYSINIRGRGTLQGETFPLVVVDGAVTEVDLASINPNDIDNITFLKDAAAASIWGVRAANGVIVVTTKKGKRRDAPSVNFSTNIMIANKPNLGYLNTMDARQQLGYEKELVDRNFLRAFPATPYFNATNLVSPGTYLAQQLKAGTITQAQYDSQVNTLSANDNRAQISKYLLRSAQSQQYNLSVDGGNDYSTYFYSASYSKELPNTVNTSGERLTTTFNNSWKLFKLATLTTSLKGTFFKYQNNGLSLNGLYAGSSSALMPYEMLADASGKGISYDRLNPAFTSTLPPVYQDWKYNYLDELANGDNVQKDNNYVVNINLIVPIFKGLTASAFYNNERTFSSARSYYNQQTYYFRNLINYYTYPTASTNSLGINDGGILSLNNTNQNNYSVRGQLDFDRVFKEKHRITALAGTEMRETNVGQNLSTLFGYNPQTGFTDNNINFSYNPTYAYVGGFSPVSYTTFNGGGYPSQIDRRRRFLSYYGNAAYTYNDKYVVSGSVRYDDYNNFGLDRKYRATPLWSTGLKWNVNREEFFKKITWVNSLALRGSYGVNGNLSLSTYPYTAIALTGSDNVTGQPSALITSLANPQLKWEKVYETNIGLDFSLFDSRLNGTFDVYKKNSKDLLFDFPISSVYAGQIGSGILTRNSASMTGKGFDAGINGMVVSKTDFSVNLGLTFSYNTNKITDTRFSESLYNSYFGYYPAGIRYVTGLPTDKLLVYRNAGLDANGLTQIYDETGKIVPATTTALSNFAALKDAGRTTAPYYGAFNTSVRYKQFTLMAQMTYQFGSVFLKPTIQNYITSTRNVSYDLSAAIAQRWQKPGDELNTQVPGLNGNGTSVYYSLSRFQNSDINVLKGDYIRLRQLSLNYQFPAFMLTRLSIKGAQAGFSVNNLGLLWRANKEGYDPDFVNYPASPRGLPAAISYNLSLGLNF